MNASAQLGDRLPLEPTRQNIRAGEHRAFHAWPAEECLDEGGWDLRHTTKARTRRTNSVCPNEMREDVLVDDLIAATEAFYAERALPVRFQISPACEPVDLDERLDSRGYEIEAPTRVQWALCSDVLGATKTSGKVEISDVMSSDWQNVHATSARDADDLTGRIAIIERIVPARGLALSTDNGQPAAIGLGVFDRDWCGVFCMYTLTEFRRRGIADSILAALARWTNDQGGAYMYLQVEEDNLSAQAFYQSRGFSTAYNYHYRTRYTP